MQETIETFDTIYQSTRIVYKEDGIVRGVLSYGFQSSTSRTPLFCFTIKTRDGLDLRFTTETSSEWELQHHIQTAKHMAYREIYGVLPDGQGYPIGKFVE